jgi:uncharacterized SAM-binding protein YcdF (DUF218 family)
MLPELKPYLTALVMPPAPLLLMIFVGALLIYKKPKFARRIIFLSVGLLWLISTNSFSLWLHNKVIPNYPFITAKELNESKVQAIVVLGGGVFVGPNVNDQQMSKTSLERLRLGIQLARQSGIPLVFSGGAGWGASDNSLPEADVAEKVLSDAFGFKLQYKESSSRDTQENAKNSWNLLSKNEITRIVLVTHSTHMPRASNEFKNVGFEVIEATVGEPVNGSTNLLSWLPSASSLELSHLILRELLAKLIQKLKSH